MGILLEELVENLVDCTIVRPRNSSNCARPGGCDDRVIFVIDRRRRMSFGTIGQPEDLCIVLAGCKKSLGVNRRGLGLPREGKQQGGQGPLRS